MDNVKKRQINKYISWISMVTVVALLAAMPLLAKSDAVEDGPVASILSGTVETGSIERSLHSGGVLASPESEEINLPTGVKILEFLVDNGDEVSGGTPLVRVDRVSVMGTITKVQETMDHLLEQMQEADDVETDPEIVAPAGGTVKQIFAREGEKVTDVMLRDGALAVLSLDGRMAVRLEVSSPLSAGDRVEVLLSDGTPVDGRVESNLDGILTVTVEDDGYPVGNWATVMSDGEPVGQGALYVRNPWRATAYSGTVDRILVDVEEETDSGDTLFRLSGVSDTVQRDALARQHQQYQALMLRLFRMYQSETIDAPCAGLISGIDEESIHLLTDSGEGYTLDLLINAPNGDDQTMYLNFAGMLLSMENGSWNVAVEMTPLTIADYRDLSGLELNPEKMTQPVNFVPTMPVYELKDGQWVQMDPVDVLPGDYLLIALDTKGTFVWAVRINEENTTPPGETEPTLPPVDPGHPEEPTLPPVTPPVTEPTVPTDPTDPTAPSEPDTDPTLPTFPTIPDFPYPDIQIPDDFWGSIGGYGRFGGYGNYGSMIPEEQEFELYDLEGDTLMTVTGQETMTLSITVDELDISAVHPGQTAIIRVEALPDQVYPAQVTSIGRTGTNNGGSSKYTVELTLQKEGSMLPGMSAAARLPLTTLTDVPVVPLAALAEEGAGTVIYTGYDGANDVLTGPVDVTVGASDGTYVEILSGLAPGDSFWYAYYDTLELSTEVDTQRSPFG